MSSRGSAVVRTLKQLGPLASNELAKKLVNQGDAENEIAARKQIQRAKNANSIFSSDPVRFDKVFLYYLENQKPGRKYANKVVSLLKRKPSYLRILKTLFANRGFITIGQIAKASACLPAGELKSPGGRKTISSVIVELEMLGIIEPVPELSQLYKIGQHFGMPRVKKKAFLLKLSAEQELLKEVLDWVRDSFLLAYDSNKIRESEFSACEFNQSYFDLHGPVYFGPFTESGLYRRTRSKGDFLVVDIVGYRSFSEVDADAFLERIRSIVHRWKTLTVTPIVFAPTFSRAAFQTLRKAGVSAVPLSRVVGANVNELLKSLWRHVGLRSGSEIEATQIEQSLKLAEGTITNSDGIVGDLKGVLFEMIIALAWKAAGYEVVLQKMAKHMTTFDECEFDVVAIRGNSCKLIECKGRSDKTKQEQKEDVERHFDYRCRIATDEYGWNITDKYSSIEAIYITSGCFSSDATTYSDATPKTIGKIICSRWDRDKLFEWLRELGQDKLCKLIQKYYSKS